MSVCCSCTSEQGPAHTAVAATHRLHKLKRGWSRRAKSKFRPGKERSAGSRQTRSRWRGGCLSDRVRHTIAVRDQ